MKNRVVLVVAIIAFCTSVLALALSFYINFFYEPAVFAVSTLH